MSSPLTHSVVGLNISTKNRAVIGGKGGMSNIGYNYEPHTELRILHHGATGIICCGKREEETGTVDESGTGPNLYDIAKAICNKNTLHVPN